MRIPGSLAFRIFALLGIVFSSSMVASCDSTARIFLRLIQLDPKGFQIVSATPIKAETFGQESRWVPACDGDAEAVRINFNLRSTQRKAVEGQPTDRDLQIRPYINGQGDSVGGGTVKLGETLNAGSFTLQLDCLAGHTATDNAGACNGTTTPTATIEDLEFVDHVEGLGRGTPIGVALLIDQSGSLEGLVEGQVSLPGSLTPICLEGQSGDIDEPTPTSSCASDPSDHRLVAAKDVLTLLNDADRAIAFGYNETIGVRIACNIPGVDDPDEQTKSVNCYSADKSLILGNTASGLPSALDGVGGLAGQGQGRTNLWEAIDTAFNFMAQQGEVARHLVVLADSPDTCRPEGSDFQWCYTPGWSNPPQATPQEPCSGAATFEKARSTIMAYMAAREAAQQANNIHISFIHYQSRGYGDMDARMQELACLTGGHYSFINANQLEEKNQKKDALQSAASELRYTFAGHWALDVSIAAFTENTTAATVARGFNYALSGALSMLAPKLHNLEKTAVFGFDGNLDTRLPLTKPCDPDADATGNSDCADFSASNAECGLHCDPESRTCVPGTLGASCANGGGVCCGALGVVPTCVMGETVCTDASNVLACP